jgi:hypothetical protein
MKVNKRYLLAIITIAILVLLIALPASAKSDKAVYEYYEVYCTYTPGDSWWEGQVYHLRGSIMEGVRIPLDEEDPVQKGSLRIEINQNLNVLTGEGTGSGSFVLDLQDVNGSIRGTWHGKFIPVGPELWIFDPDIPGRTVGHGVGDLFGLKTMTTFNHLIPDQIPLEYRSECPGGIPFLGAYGSETVIENK